MNSAHRRWGARRSLAADQPDGNDRTEKVPRCRPAKIGPAA